MKTDIREDQTMREYHDRNNRWKYVSHLETDQGSKINPQELTVRKNSKLRELYFRQGKNRNPHVGYTIAAAISCRNSILKVVILHPTTHKFAEKELQNNETAIKYLQDL